jgi:FdhD protein
MIPASFACSSSSLTASVHGGGTSPMGSSCGVCGGREAVDRLVAGLVAVPDTARLRSAQFDELMSAMRKLQTVFTQTGGAHAAAVFDRNAQIIAVAEDLGRHNALDKVIGMCLLKDADLSGCGVLLSSRLSLEMITKAIRAGFEIIAAVSAPTSLAIEIADRFGVTLGGFVRGGRVTIYSQPQRIVELGRGRCPLKGSVPLSLNGRRCRRSSGR